MTLYDVLFMTTNIYCCCVFRRNNFDAKWMYPDRRQPHKRTIGKLVVNLKESGSFGKKSCNEGKVSDVILGVTENRNTSVRLNWTNSRSMAHFIIQKPKCEYLTNTEFVRGRTEMLKDTDIFVSNTPENVRNQHENFQDNLNRRNYLQK